MTCFVIAMPNEADCVTAHLTDAREEVRFGRRTVRGRLGNRDVAVVVAGIGKDNAAAATQLALSEFRPDEVVNVGLAGALCGKFEIGQVCPVAKAVEYDFDLAQVNGTEIGVLDERKDLFIPFALAPDTAGFALATGDCFKDDETNVAWLLSLGVELRDMEGASVAHVCETAGVRCRAWKCVSDIHGMTSMVGQYRENTPRALECLRAAVPALLDRRTAASLI